MEPKKDYAWLINSLLAALLTVLAGYFGYTLNAPAPSPTPTPSPSPSATPTPIPSPSPTAIALNVMYQGLNNPLNAQNLKPSVLLNLAKKETTGFFVNATECSLFTLKSAPTGVDIKVFKPEIITTKSPSYKGAIVGPYFDPLIETKDCIKGWAWIDLSVSPNAVPGRYDFKIDDLPVTLNINSLDLADKPSIPFYSQLQPYRLLLGHKMSSSTGIDVQGPLIRKYVDLLRAHKIEPFGQSPANPPVLNGKLDLDQWSALNGSFRYTVMEGAIAPIALMTFSSPQTTQYLQAAEATIKAEPALANAWNYLKDEPQTTELPTVVSLLQTSKTNAPSLKTMVTHEPWDQAVGILDHPTPAMQLWKQDARFPSSWIYGACPAHGSCANGFLGDNIGIPDLMIDQPTIHFRMFPLVALATASKATLYYTVNESFGQIDPWTNIYLFGGNGDGTLVYPGIQGERGFTAQTPVASLRLKLIRQGMFDIEYLKLLPKASLNTAISTPIVWTKNHDIIDGLRSQAAQ